MTIAATADPGYRSAVLGAIAGNVVLGAIGSIPLFALGAQIRDLPVVYFLGYVHYYLGWQALVLMAATVIGGAAGAGLALSRGGYARARSTAFVLLTLELAASVICILVAIALFGLRPQLYLAAPASAVLLVILLVSPFAARAIDLWFGRPR